MATPADAAFAEMRLAKVVALAVSPDDGPSYCIVLEGVSQDRQLPIEIGPAEAFNLAATLTGSSLPGRWALSSPLACCEPSAAGSGRCVSTG